MPFNPPKSVTGRALEEWKRLLPYMTENGFTTEENVQAFASYCLAVKRRDECEDAIEEFGLLVESRRDGHLVRNHATMAQQASDKTILDISKRFGFTPKDKQGLIEEKATKAKPSWVK